MMIAFLHWVFLICPMTVALAPAYGLAASSAYVQTTQGLDLTRVHLVVVTPPEWHGQLTERATSLFEKAGLSLYQSNTPSIPPIATLTLTLDPQPLDDTCPGKVLYVPSLSLIEPIIITRNSVTLNDSTWLAHSGAEVREPITLVQLQMHLDGFVHQFLTDYAAANPEWHTQGSLHTATPFRADTEPGSPVVQELDAAHTNNGLKDLHINRLQLSVSAGPFATSLTTRAIHQFTEAGLSILPGHGDRPTLGVELVQQSLEDHCPGNVLYEQGLYLVESVQITRNPHVSFWSDTWVRDTRRVVPLVSQKQLEADQDALLQQFLHALQIN